MGKYEFDFGSLISGVDKNTVGLKDLVKLMDFHLIRSLVIIPKHHFQTKQLHTCIVEQ